MDEFSWIEKALSTVGLEKQHLLAVLLALLVTWGSSQAIKFLFQIGGRRVTVIAFCIAFLAAYTTSPPVGLTFDWPALWVALSAALLAPTGYKWLKLFAKKRGWSLAEAMSVDDRINEEQADG